MIGDARLGSKTDSRTVIERLLSISGEDAITVNRKFRDQVSVRLPTRFMIISNELPAFGDSSGAIASRFVITTLTRSFLGKENIHLEQALLAELPGILNWALVGLDRISRQPFTCRYVGIDLKAPNWSRNGYPNGCSSVSRVSGPSREPHETDETHKRLLQSHKDEFLGQQEGRCPGCRWHIVKCRAGARTS